MPIETGFYVPVGRTSSRRNPVSFRRLYGKGNDVFPPDFKWAAATAAHQVEGNNTNNDWWAWEQTGQHVRGGQKSGLACDWWGAGFDRDMDFAAQMNHTGHRLSIEWSRIEPKEGQWDTAAHRSLSLHADRPCASAASSRW